MQKHLDYLESLGWQPWEKDNFGIFKKAIIQQEDISFNEETFNEEFLKSEKDQFWAQHRIKILEKHLEMYNLDTLWEIGAGNGNVAIPLNEKGINIFAVEPLELGCQILSKNRIPVFNATLLDMNLPSNSLDAIGMFDLLGHVFDYGELLFESNRILRQDGKLILLLPAYEWLYSDYDLAIKQLRRFSRKKVINELRNSGFEILHSQYIFSLLVLPAIFLRWLPYKLGRRTQFSEYEQKNSKLLRLGKIVNPVLRIFFKFEEKFNPKFGLSIFIVAYKP